jgi:hypothetical protein
VWNVRAHKYANIKNQGLNASNVEVVPFASTSATGQHVQIAMENATYVSMIIEGVHAKSVLAMGCVFTCVKSIHVMNAVAHHVAHMEGGKHNVVTA